MICILPSELHDKGKELWEHHCSGNLSAQQLRRCECQGTWGEQLLELLPPCILVPKVLPSFATLLLLQVIKGLLMALSLSWKEVTRSNSNAVGWNLGGKLPLRAQLWNTSAKWYRRFSLATTRAALCVDEYLLQNTVRKARAKICAHYWEAGAA